MFTMLVVQKKSVYKYNDSEWIGGRMRHQSKTEFRVFSTHETIMVR